MIKILCSKQNVYDWYQATVYIQFKMDDERFYWDRRFTNERTDTGVRSLPCMEKDRWWHVDVMRIIHVTDKYVLL